MRCFRSALRSESSKITASMHTGMLVWFWANAQHKKYTRKEELMKALVLSGGGALGAFEAGAIQSLRDSGDGFDLVCGSSISAINASPRPSGGLRTETTRAAPAVRLVVRCAHRKRFIAVVGNGLVADGP